MEAKMRVSFSPPDITEAEIEAVSDALRSGWITTGPRVKELEARLMSYLAADGCACLNSQTACAELALHLLGVGPGDEVIVPAYTYTATASVVCHVGARPVIVDCAPNSFEMDYEQVAKAINEKTKAIAPVDLAGVPCDYNRVFEVVESSRGSFSPASPLQEAIGRIAVCADTAHALGATYHGKFVGSIADFSSFSFHAVKNLTTAEGGCLTWRAIEGYDSEELHHQIQLLSLHGQDKDALAKTKLGAWEYDIIGPWYKCNMTDMAAAMGLVQLDRYPQMLARRRELIERYDEALAPLGIEGLPHYTQNHQSSGHLYICRIAGATAEERNRIIELMAEAGVACNVHYKPLPMMTAYKNMGYGIADYPNAYAQFANEITLPLHTRLTDEQQEYTIECFAFAVKEVRA